MNVLLLKLPYCRHPESRASKDPRLQNSYRPMPSLALATLSAFLKTYGPESVRISAIDANMCIARGDLGGEKERNVLGHLRMCLAFEAYDVVCLSVMFAHNVRWLEEAVALIRENRPEARIVIGGAGAQDIPGCEVIHGEGEHKLLEALTGIGLPAGTRNCFSLEQNLEALPIPDWSAVANIERYFESRGERVLPIEASRGCPYDCSYCTTTGSWGSRVRYKSVPQLMREIAALVSRYGVEKLHFVDDNLAFNSKWFLEFLGAFKHRAIPVQLDASNFSIKHLDAQVAEAMLDCGFKRISVAIESASPEIQRATGKRLNLDEVPVKIEMLKRAGLSLHLCWMLGFPGETKKQVESTLKLAAELGADSNQFLTVVPYPGTRIYAQASEAGILADDFNLDSLECRGARPFKNQDWTYDWLEDCIYDANIKTNFLENPWLYRDREGFARHLDGVLQNHPDHAIALIMAGWLNPKGSTAQWTRASEVLAKPEGKVFRKYLDAPGAMMERFRGSMM